MQVTQAQQNITDGYGLSHSRYEQHDQFYQSNRELSIDFSDSGDTVTITQRESTVYRESLYTKEGTTLTAHKPSETAVAAPQTELGAAALAEQVVDHYLGEIRERVDTLIREAVELSARFQRQVLGIGGDSGAGETITVHESSEQYTLYEERSESVTTVTLDMADFSAGNTASRIADFALSHYDGGDRTEYAEKVRSAIMEGFHDAEQGFGGTLPDVSYETIQLANDAIDRFAQVGSVDLNA